MRRALFIAAGGALGAGLLAAGARQPAGVSAPTTAIERGGCVTADCHPGVKDKAFQHGPVFVDACESCHTLADPAAHAFEFTRGRAETCSFCHVVEAPEGEHVHAPFEQGECLSCHDPHGGAVPSLLRGQRYGESCDSCHADVTGSRELVHGPAAAGACGACHRPHSSPNPSLLIEQGRDLCLRCHVSTGIEIERMPVMHEPVAGDCRVCHDPHQTNHEAILLEEPRVLCTSCHEDIAHAVNEASTQHDAVIKDRSCLNCHAAHGSEHARLMKNDTASLCFECHDQKIEMPDGTTLANMKERIEGGKSLHGPVAQDDCAACHDIHGGDHTRLLVREYPSDLYYPFSENAYALCFTCHDRNLVLEEHDTSVTRFRNGDRNLHFVHVHQDKKGRSCRVCHDAHAADREQIIRSSIPFGPAGWELPIGFTPATNGGSCQSGCHAPYAYDRANPVIYPSTPPDESWRGADLVPGKDAQAPKPPKKD